MEFHITAEERRLQERCRCLANDFATRAASMTARRAIPSKTMLRSVTPGFTDSISRPSLEAAAWDYSAGHSPSRSSPRAAHQRPCRSTCTCRSLDHSLGLAQRYLRPNTGDLGSSVSCQVFRRRSRDSDHAHGHDPRRCPRIVQELTTRTLVSRWRRRPCPVPAA